MRQEDAHELLLAFIDRLNHELGQTTASNK